MDPLWAAVFWEYLLFHGVHTSLTLVLTLLFLTLFCFSACVVCVLFLKYFFREAPLTWLMGSAVSCCVDPGETGHTWHTAALALLSRRPTLQSLHCQQLATYMDVHVTGTEVVARVLTRVAMLSLLLSASLALFPYPQIMKG